MAPDDIIDWFESVLQGRTLNKEYLHKPLAAGFNGLFFFFDLCVLRTFFVFRFLKKLQITEMTVQQTSGWWLAPPKE